MPAQSSPTREELETITTCKTVREICYRVVLDLKMVLITELFVLDWKRVLITESTVLVLKMELITELFVLDGKRELITESTVLDLKMELITGIITHGIFKTVGGI